MGCCCSGGVKFVPNDKVPGQDLDAYKAFQTIYLSDSEINKMYQSFCNFDVNGSGEVSYVEFLTILDLEDTPISREVFNEMDDSHDWNMTFREFVLNMWMFCTRSKQSISMFAFDIFDEDDSGSLNQEEITDMVGRIYGKKGLSHDIRLIIKKMDKNKDGKIDRKEFVDSVDKFPGLLFPAFHLQTTFREHVVNEKFWIEKQLQAGAVRKMPEVIELFAGHGGKMAKRKVETKKKNDSRREKKSTRRKVACEEYDGVDIGASMSEERIKSEHLSANRTIEKNSGKKINSEDEAARVIQAAQIRKKNKKKRDSSKKKRADKIDAALN